ncbi:MAG: 4Fe-4S binding protein [Candidatus Baldrarchaeia archaeon]
MSKPLTKRVLLLNLLRELAIKEPEGPIEVPEGLEGFGEVHYNPAACIACGKCINVCEDDALSLENVLDLSIFLDPHLNIDEIRSENRRILVELIRKLAKRMPERAIIVPDGIPGFGTIRYKRVFCTACKKCVEACTEGAIRILPIFNLKAIFEEMRSESR